MKYIKKFTTLGEQTAYLAEADIDTYVGYVSDNDTVYYDDAIPNYAEHYLTFDIIDDGTIKYSDGSPIYYSIDDGATWTEIDGASFNVSAGDKVLWKGTNGYYGNASHSKFEGSTARFNVKGNIMSLVYGDNFVGQTTLSEMYAFTSLFKGLNIVSAKNLILPATTLTQSCYWNMFAECASLTTAPELPATTLAGGCYNTMFYNCYNLNYIKCLATDASITNYTANWVSGVPSSGTFVKAASMNDWPTGVNGIPQGWTVVDA